MSKTELNGVTLVWVFFLDNLWLD